MEWLNFRHLYAFWMVARMGSFTRAASQMRVAQSAISTQVAALEEYLEEPLLIRTSRSFELTPAGHELLRQATPIFAQSRAINALIKDKNALRGQQKLRLGIVGGVSRNFVYRFLVTYIQKAGNARVSVSTGSYDELCDLLRRFELDAIVTLELPKKKDMSEVSYQKLGESKMCIVSTPAIIAKVRKGRLPKSLDVYKFRHPSEVNVLDEHVRPQVKCNLNLRLDTDDVPLLRFFAKSGSGLTVMPRVGILDDLASGTVASIDLPTCPEVSIYGIRSNHPHPGLDIEGLAQLWPDESDA